MPDYNALAQASEAKADAEVKAAEAKVGRMRAGVFLPEAKPQPSADVTLRGFDVRMDWRGETAYYLEPGRQVWLFASYWGRGTGNLEHINAVWEYTDGRCEKLTGLERLEVLRRVIRYIHDHEHLQVTAKELAGEAP